MLVGMLTSKLNFILGRFWEPAFIQDPWRSHKQIMKLKLEAIRDSGRF